MSKCCLVFMPLLILLQGIIYFGLSIWDLVMGKCSNEITDIGKNPFGFIMDLIYFYDKICGNPNVTVAGFTDPVTLDDTNFAEPTVNRTFGFIIGYLVISALWILFSMFSISAIGRGAKKNLTILCFIMWVSAVLVGCILDAIATGYHIYDLVHTTSGNNTFAYLGVTTTERVMSYIRSFDAYFVVPSLVMMSISSRIFIIWLINIIGSIHCVSVLHNYLKENLVATSSTVLVLEE